MKNKQQTILETVRGLALEHESSPEVDASQTHLHITTIEYEH
jgi:hypothetical protein